MNEATQGLLAKATVSESADELLALKMPLPLDLVTEVLNAAAHAAYRHGYTALYVDWRDGEMTLSGVYSGERQ